LRIVDTYSKLEMCDENPLRFVDASGVAFGTLLGRDVIGFYSI
jgi:hypothetical protein